MGNSRTGLARPGVEAPPLPLSSDSSHVTDFWPFDGSELEPNFSLNLFETLTLQFDDRRCGSLSLSLSPIVYKRSARLRLDKFRLTFGAHSK